MLNTALWSTQTGNSTIIFEPALLVDLEEAEPTSVATATGLTQPSLPEKPYRYGAQKMEAMRLRMLWDQMHPYDPMP